MRSILLTLALLVTLAGCRPRALGAPPPEPPPREPTPVAAPMAQTWAATLQQLREDGAKVRTADSTSGTIVTEELIIPYAQRGVGSDCGANSDPASNVVYTLRVTGGPTGSAVHAAGRFTLRGLGKIRQCTSKEFWERNLEARIKERAERR